MKSKPKSKVLPPCQAGCPVRTDAGRYARLVAEGRYEEAYEVVCRTNPLPSVCGHICQRLCEKQCRRREVDAPVALRALKHFAMEQAVARGEEPPPPVPTSRARVAVVGAGPAGLAAAHDLRRTGHPVTVFERLDRPGGMLNVIPRYRLPEEAVKADIEAILAAGVDLRCNYELGRDAAAPELMERGFDAVIVATGLSRSRGIAVPGFGAQRFTAAIPWMTDIWLGNKVDVGKRVVVVGGGNVAVDVARTARRLGAVQVTMICLEDWDEMPAEPKEIELAQSEGIQIRPRQALKRVLNRENEIVAVELMLVVSVFDDEGRFRPSYDPARIRTLNTDMVVLSVGQAPDRSWARGAPIQTDDRGRAIVDRDTHATSHPRVFVAGESLRGPGSAIQAIADGHRVAEVVTTFLETGQVVAPAEDGARPLDPFPPDVVARLREIRPAAAEPQPFTEHEQPALDEQTAAAEADRCFGCLEGAVIDEGKCATCLTCFRICPLDAVEIGESIAANPARCQACGVCASACPAEAIELSYAGLAVPKAKVDTRPEPLIVQCRHARNGAPTSGETLTMPCLARLKPVELLRLFGKGYQNVVLHACAQEKCKYGSAWENIRAVVGFVRTILQRARPDAQISWLPPDGHEPDQEISVAGETT